MGLLHPKAPASHVKDLYIDYVDDLTAIDAEGTVPVPQGPGLGVANQLGLGRASPDGARRLRAVSDARSTGQAPRRLVRSFCTGRGMTGTYHGHACRREPDAGLIIRTAPFDVRTS